MRSIVRQNAHHEYRTLAPILEAILERGERLIVENFLAEKEDVNCSDEARDTLATCAAGLGLDKCLQCLVDAGADMNRCVLVFALNCLPFSTDQRGDGLLVASQRGRRRRHGPVHRG